MSLAAQIVRDADRLDAMGAVGIGRAFAFGGHVGLPDFGMTSRSPRPRHARTMSNTAAAVSWITFSTSSFGCADLMCTASGRRIADRRHRRLAQFVVDFVGSTPQTTPPPSPPFSNNPP